jgi:hypothetical protein
VIESTETPLDVTILKTAVAAVRVERSLLEMDLDWTC